MVIVHEPETVAMTLRVLPSGEPYRIEYGQTRALRVPKAGAADPGWLVCKGRHFGEVRNHLGDLVRLILELERMGT